MNWVLLAPNGTRLASGSWQACVDEGHDLGVLQRRIHPDGIEAAPRWCDFARGHVIAPEGMFPESECADEWLYG